MDDLDGCLVASLVVVGSLVLALALVGIIGALFLGWAYGAR